MKVHGSLFVFITILVGFTAAARENNLITAKTVIVKIGIVEEQISKDWRRALESRMDAKELDSVSHLRRPLTNEELAWIKLIESKTHLWNSYRDSLETPFQNCHVPDTVYVLLGFTGVDDAFTYKYNTVCLDLTALQRVYGSATLDENSERINRIYAHEFTHLITKEWVRKKKFTLVTFKDSVLWECFYEGLGMYRSLPKKWIPQKGTLPAITTEALEKLCPVFVDRIIMVQTAPRLSRDEKNKIVKNLSRGSVEKKWGAFTVAIWLSLEANGADSKLIPWTEKGSDSIVPLAKKYLTGENKKRFEKIFSSDVR